MYKFKEAEKYEQKLNDLCNDNKSRARCLAEQAFAFAFELCDDAIGRRRYHAAHNLYEEALKLSNDDLDEEERQDWIFGDAIACKKIGSILNTVEREPYGHWFSISLAKFYRITQARGIHECKDKNMLSESWRYIGEICGWLERKKATNRSSEIKELMAHEELGPLFKQNLSNPEACLEKAIEINPSDPRLLVRLARMVMYKDHERSLELLQNSIDMDNTRFNRLAYATRGEIFLKRYHEILNARDATVPDQELLHKARIDLEKALEMNVSPEEYVKLARVWYLQSLDDHGEVSSTDGKVCLDRALMYYAKAMDCQNGAMSEEFNRYRGICLVDAKEYDAAIESFKRAIECSPNSHAKNFTHLMKVFLIIIKESEPDGTQRKRTLRELSYWATEAISHCSKTNLRKYVTSELWNEMPTEMDIFLQYLRETHDHSHFYRRVIDTFQQFSDRTNIGAVGLKARGKPSPTRMFSRNRDRSQVKEHTEEWTKVTRVASSVARTFSSDADHYPATRIVFSISWKQISRVVC